MMQYLNNKFNVTTETKIFCHIFVCSSGMILDLRGTRQILETWEWYEFPLTNYGDQILHFWMGTYFISFKIKKKWLKFYVFAPYMEKQITIWFIKAWSYILQHVHSIHRECLVSLDI